MRIVVTGGHGLVGSQLVPRLRAAGHDVFAVDVTASAEHRMDITDPASVEAGFAALIPDHVVNLAAYTAVDACETNSEVAASVNALGAGHVAAACARHGAFLTHISTDYVFDGEKGVPYTPSDPTSPQSVYARTKLDGETAIQAALPEGSWQIVRCQNIYGEVAESFPRAILDRVRAGKPVFGVTDQILSPTYAGDVAAGVAACTELGIGAPGVLLLSSRGACSRYLYVKRILEFGGFPDTPIAAWTHARVGATYPDLATRPRYAVFDHDDLEHRTGHRPPHWEAALRTFLTAEEQV